MLLHAGNVAVGDILDIEYTDAKGQPSARRVRVEDVSDSGFKGFCYLRGEGRAFRYDRVVAADVVQSVDAATF